MHLYRQTTQATMPTLYSCGILIASARVRNVAAFGI